jgi:branched-chain amino acid aminotransferase
VFSTLRVAEGVLFAWERHWARIKRDAAALHVPIPEDSEGVRCKLLDLVEANQAPNCTMRVAIVRNGGGMWAGPSNGRPCDLIGLTADLKNWGDSVKLACVPQARHAACQFAGVKILSWAMNLTWLEAAQARGFDEALLSNERGEVAECTGANLFIASGSQVWTPPLNSGCLPGITREVLLGEIQVPGIRIGEKMLTTGDLERADEVFITSTTRDLLPVMQIEDQKVGRSDEVRQALTQGFANFLGSYVAAHKAAVAR